MIKSSLDIYGKLNGFRDKFDKEGASKREAKIALEAWVAGSAKYQEVNADKIEKSTKKKKMKPVDVAWFCEQLATTQAAGMPLFRSLGMIASMQRGKAIGQAAGEISSLMQEGASLSDAMQPRAKEFTPLVLALVTAGEVSGQLEDSLTRAAKALHSRLALRSKIRGAMFYPTAVLMVAITLVSVMLLVVIPKFESIYAQNSTKLPAVTLTVIMVAHKAPFFLLGFLVLIGILAGLVFRSKSDINLRRKVDIVKSKLPLVGTLLTKGATARVSGTMAGLMGSGISVLEALDFAGETSGSTIHSDALTVIKTKVGEGATLSSALGDSGVFPELMVNLVRVGEESGDVPKLLDRYAETAEADLTSTAERITTLIEPIMMILIGTIVGTFVLAMYLPIFKMGDAIGN